VQEHGRCAVLDDSGRELMLVPHGLQIEGKLT
jgi:hypothetical protein